jgi:pSer/pThr/pTyr-binding forkhead associated (FHA) protein
MAKLVLFQPDGSTRDVVLSRERMTIGRRPDNDICLSNLAVSGEHAAVVTIFADSFLEDLGSTNGTLVNGKAITKHFLRERDEIDVGRHRLVYLSDDNAKLPIDAANGLYRAAAGDLGNMVEHAKPKSKAAVRRPRREPGEHSPGDGEAVDVQTADAPMGRARIDNAPMADDAPIAKLHRGNGHVDATARMRAAPAKVGAVAASPATVAIASIKVLAGTNAGKLIALTKQQTTIGRAGVQVAIIVHTGMVFELRPVEGELPPMVNGTSLPREGVLLSTGDAIDIAGSRLEFVGAPVKV